MLKHLQKLLLLAALFVPWATQAQNDSCTLKIVGQDSYADGWNNGYLSVVQGGTTIATFDAENADNNGAGPELDSTFVTVASGVPVSFVWTSGNFDSEVTIWIYNSDGVMLYTVNYPSQGTLITMSNACSQCYVPTGLSTLAGTDEITVSWTPGGEETSWLVSDGTTIYTTTDTFYTFYNLTLNTNYTISVAAFCSIGDTSSWASINARTLAGDPISILPYTCGFETSDEIADWVLENGTQPNQWVIDTAVSNNGLQSLYISSDNGATNNYNISSASYVFAYATFQLDSGEYAYSYDWRASGESCCDFIRAAMVPASVDIVAGSYCGFSSGSDVPAGGLAMDGAYRLNQSSSWITQIGTFIVPANGSYKMVFMWRNDGSVGTQPPAAIDNIRLTELTCPIPTNLVSNSVDADEFTVSWQPGGEETNWIVWLNGEYYANANDTTFTFTNLDANTVYNVSISAYCGVDDTSLAVGPISVRTLAGAPISDLPYTCGFESETEIADWVLENGTQTNQWVIDSAVNNGGSHSLYISNDGGVSNSYSTGSTSYVFAYATFQLDAGEYAYSYDWRAYGETSYDFIRAAMVPASVEITAGSYNGFNNSSAVPAGGIAIDGAYRLNLSNNWNNQSGTFIIPADGTYKMVFMWRNDASAGTQPPAAIDNITLTVISCPAPSNVVVDSVSASEITMHWSATGDETSWIVSLDGTIVDMAQDTTYTFTDLDANTGYTLAVAAYCGSDDTSFFTAPITVLTACGEQAIPFSVNFDNMQENDFPRCWTNYSNTNIYVESGDGVNGSNALHFQGPGIVITPRIPLEGNQIQLECDLRAEGTSSGTMEIGFTTDPVTMSDYVTIATAPNITSFTHYTVVFDSASADTGYVVFKQVATSTIWYWWLDNMSVYMALPCAIPSNLAADASQADSVVLSWTGNDDAAGYDVVVLPANATFDEEDADFVSVTDTWLVVDTLTIGQQYQFYVRTDCGSNGYSYWVGPYTFTPGIILMPTSGSLTLHTCGTVIYDDGGPNGNYSNSVNSTIYIYPSDDTMAAVINGTSYTEGNWDYLRIYDGIGTTGMELWNDYGVNSLQTFGPVTSYSGPLTVVFHSDGSINYSGFELNVSCAPLPDCYPASALTVDSLTPTDITLSWNGPSGADYRLTITDGTNTNTTDVTSNSYTFTGLTGQTTYTITVSTLCDDTINGSSTIVVTTGCAAMAVPFCEDFDTTAYGSFYPPCWANGNLNADNASTYPRVVYLSGDESDRMVIMYQGAYLVTPVLSTPLNQLELTLNYLSGGDSNYLVLGYLTNIANPVDSMVVIDTLYKYNYPASGLGVLVYRNLSDLPANASNLVIMSPLQNVSNYYDFVSALCIDMPRTCFAVENVTHTSSSPTSVTLTWTAPDNAPQGYIVEYGPRMFQHGTGTIATTTTNSITLNGLDPQNPYQVYIKTVCSSTDTSTWTLAYEFSTLCGTVSQLPLFYSFDQYVEAGANYAPRVPNCWAIDSLSVYTGTNNMPLLYRLTADGNMVLYMEEPTVLAMPEMGHAIDSLMVSFNMELGDENMALVVGVVSSQVAGFGSSFTAVDTLTYADNGQVEVYLAGYAGSDRYIAFKNIIIDTNLDDYSVVYIDSLIVDYMPSCIPVQNLRVTGNTATSVTLDWNDVVPATSWQVSYGTAPLSDPLQGTVVTTTSHPYTINGLSDQNTYYFYVRNVCSSTDNSTWRGLEDGIIPGMWIMRPNQTDTVYMCGGTIFDDGGPSGSYSSSQNSTVIIMPESSNNVVSIYGSSYTESSWDYITIYDGIGTGGTVLWTDNGINSLTNFGPFESTTGPITLTFHTDGSVTYSGFEIHVECVSTTCRVSDVHLDENVAASSSSLTVAWTAPADAQSYQIEYGPAGFTHGNGNMMTSTTNSVTIGGLSYTTAYDVYVRSICTGADTGSWSRGTFATAMCDNFTMATNFDTTMNATTSSYSPIGNSYYNYSYVQTIVDANRLSDIAGDITAMAFSAANTSASNYFNHITVYLANVQDSDFSDFILPDATHNFVKVIDDADFSYDAVGLHLQPFDTVFSWDGVSNILVSVVRNHGSWSNGAQFDAHSYGMSKMCYAFNDNNAYDYTSVTSGNPSTTAGDIYLYSCGVSCPRPSSLYASNVNYSSATLNWTGNASGYEVAVKAATDGTWPTSVSTNTATTYNVTGLQPSTLYQFRVRAICDEDMQSDWMVASFTTDSLPCFAPTDLTVASTGYTTVTLDWTPGGNETAWSVRIWNTNFDTTVTVSNHPATVGGLLQNFSYSASVAALCGDGSVESEMSDAVTFTTGACEQVTGVTVSNVTSNSAVVTWNGTSSSYEVDYGTLNHGQGTGTTVTVTGNSYTITGLDPETAYSVFVRAICGTGLYGPWSTQANFTTEDGEGIDMVEGSANLMIYPNPAKDATSITLSGVTGDVVISVVDMNGRVVMTDRMSCDGDCAKTMEVAGLAQGAYFVRVSGDNLNMVKKLVVK